MKSAIVTGFSPFGEYKFNPTQDLAREVDGKEISGFKIRGLVLQPLYHEASKTLIHNIKEHIPDVIISTGLSSSIQGIRFEHYGANLMLSKYKDGKGRRPNGEPLVRDGPNTYETNVNESLLASKLESLGIDTEVSFHAGSFVCNSLIYLTMREIEDKRLPIKFVFFHAPWTDDYADLIKAEKDKITIPKSHLEKAVEIILDNV